MTGECSPPCWTPLTAVEATLNDAQPNPGLRYPGAADLTKAFDSLRGSHGTAALSRYGDSPAPG